VKGMSTTPMIFKVDDKPLLPDPGAFTVYKSKTIHYTPPNFILLL
jgi:hypothetical protein